ncbi:MAG TPA: hypothetical protein VFV78_06820 [Vicinamibacterales bacterium]|nr:hypothetical protein [Vicinamibacterales bacterium]
MKKLFCAVVLAGVCAGVAAPARAQSRPLVTEDPETVPAGFILLEAGVDFLYGAKYPATGLTGNLTRLGTFGLSLGVSSIAEVQVDGALANRLGISAIDPTAPLHFRYTGGSEATSSFEDLSIGAKVRFVSETESRPALAVRFVTRLPMVSTETGLGTGTTDFNVGLALAKTVNSTRVAGNFGLGIMGDPVEGDRNNYLFTYGLSFARAVRTGAELVVELNGRLDTGAEPPPVGTESRAVVRVGGRFTRGPVRLDAGLLLGVTSHDPDWGVTFGATWVFKAFTVK